MEPKRDFKWAAKPGMPSQQSGFPRQKLRIKGTWAPQKLQSSRSRVSLIKACTQHPEKGGPAEQRQSREGGKPGLGLPLLRKVST